MTEPEFTDLVQTALYHRQEAMDLRDALREAAQALDQAGFTFSADKAWRAAGPFHSGESEGT